MNTVMPQLARPTPGVFRVLIALLLAVVAVVGLTLVASGEAPDARSGAAVSDTSEHAAADTAAASPSTAAVTVAAPDPAGPAAPDDVLHRQAGSALTALAAPTESTAGLTSLRRDTPPRASGTPLGSRALYMLLSIDRT